MKKIVMLLLTLMLCATLVTTAYASQEYLVYDQAELLTNRQEESLTEQLQEISRTYDAQILIVTLDSAEGPDLDEYTEALYEAMDFGYGKNHDGVLLLVCMNPRQYRILTNGFAGDAIGDSRIDSICEAIEPDLRAGNYQDAFTTFANECQYYLDGHINGFPFRVTTNLIVALIAGFVIALIVTGIWKGQLKSVRMQTQANAYIRPGSMQITQASDIYMYRNIVRVKRAENNSSGKGGSRHIGGGSF